MAAENMLPDVDAVLGQARSLMDTRLVSDGPDFLLTETGTLLSQTIEVLERSRLVPGIVVASE